MERGVEIFVAINFLIIGASHLFQPHEWIRFFKAMRNYGRAGVMAYGFLSLSFGSIIVAFHWVWDGTVPVIVTCIGITQVVKSFIAFLIPELSLRTMSRPMAENLNGYRIGGAIFLGLSIIIMLHLWKS